MSKYIVIKLHISKSNPSISPIIRIFNSREEALANLKKKCERYTFESHLVDYDAIMRDNGAIFDAIDTAIHYTIRPMENGDKFKSARLKRFESYIRRPNPVPLWLADLH
jgi:hypothetical protein